MPVILPGIHDSELRRIEIPGDKTLSLTFETIRKELRSIILEGVEDFRCDALLAGNIISDLWKIEEPALDDLVRVYCRESQFDKNRPLSEADRDMLRRKQEAVRRGDLIFLRLESSYGCVMDALCRGFRIA
jgi:hypothetical protein